MNRRSFFAVACAFALFGCTPRRTFVVVDAEESVIASTRSLVIVVRGQPDGEPRFRQVFEGEALTFPLLLELVEDRSERFTVEASGFGEEGARGPSTSSRLVASRHTRQGVIEVTLDAACAGVSSCRLDRLEGCVQGACVSATPTDW